ncbi:homoserine O-acetyltransferase MetX [Synoicihabitans lomoniglobus]|uniref:Homoserine O-acetyltransferase n=1 Tax=Synoicihabitans lomoniglobus TaxID=2909285 RepID=A0AAE9ZVV8_9BACT|nr:homoserine O-acetyltransferase [Opitutaceae bacterium LMO-M01]WED63820.1 homoserine O-acetyltransferase [Opitutaceae bacterium LMO-M01]
MNDAALDEFEAAHAEPGEVGVVVPQDYVSDEPFTFDCGRTIPGFTIRYETYGRLNATGTNAILVCHALSGDHHCAGIHHLTDRKVGWWNNIIGPGKALDTNHYFVACANVIGGCQGSTGPLSTDPETGRPYGINFPIVTINDMVRAQERWLRALGVTQLHAAMGGSMGGMQVLQFGITFPGFVKRMIAMATTARESAQAIAFNEVGRQAILQDPDWADGNYATGGGPKVGLAIARMMAHITYLSDASMARKFGRRTVAERPRSGAAAATVPTAGATDTESHAFDAQFEVESYLRYQGKSFINRFDANSYLYITRALDQFDLAAGSDSLEAAFAPLEARSLVVGFTSDWLFTPEQNRAIAMALLRAGKNASYAELTTDLGHDSFLLESPQLYDLVRDFLTS